MNQINDFKNKACFASNTLKNLK